MKMGGRGVTGGLGETKAVRWRLSRALTRVAGEEEDSVPGGSHGRSETEESARQREDPRGGGRKVQNEGAGLERRRRGSR